MPVVVKDRRSVQTVLKTVVVTQVQFVAGCSRARFGVRQWWTCPLSLRQELVFYGPDVQFTVESPQRFVDGGHAVLGVSLDT